MGSFAMKGDPEMIELLVNDMMCGDCAAKVMGAISTVDGGGRAEIDLAGRWVRIASRKPAAQFVSALGGLGFTPIVWWDGNPAPLTFPR